MAALANKTARIAWAVAARAPDPGEDYTAPAALHSMPLRRSSAIVVRAVSVISFRATKAPPKRG